MKEWNRLNQVRDWIREILVRDYGMSVHQGVAPDTGSYVQLRLVSKNSIDPPVWQGVSWIVSFFTFSLVPGYVSERNTLNFRFEARDATGSIVAKTASYEYGLGKYIWLPLIVYPDSIFFITSGGELSSEREKRKQAEELAVKAFVYDAIQQLSGSTPAGWIAAGPSAQVCP